MANRAEREGPGMRLPVEESVFLSKAEDLVGAGGWVAGALRFGVEGGWSSVAIFWVVSISFT